MLGILIKWCDLGRFIWWHVLLPAPGFIPTEEEPRLDKELGLQRIQYIFIFMCFKQWLMLVGYTRSTILPSLDFWLGLHTTLHLYRKVQYNWLHFRIIPWCSVVTITVAEDVKILSGPTLDICGLFTAWWSPKNMKPTVGLSKLTHLYVRNVNRRAKSRSSYHRWNSNDVKLRDKRRPETQKLCIFAIMDVSYTHQTLTTICSV